MSLEPTTTRFFKSRVAKRNCDRRVKCWVRQETQRVESDMEQVRIRVDVPTTGVGFAKRIQIARAIEDKC